MTDSTMDYIASTLRELGGSDHWPALWPLLTEQGTKENSDPYVHQ